MMRRGKPLSLTALAATVSAAAALSGCAQMVGTGLGHRGIHERPEGIEASAVDRAPASRAEAERPEAHVGGYESTGTYGLERYATASPASFARFMSPGVDAAAGAPLSVGLSRVLPLTDGFDAVGVQHFGPVTFGVAGPGAGLGALWLGSGLGLAREAMREAAREGTYERPYPDRHPDVFAFVTLGAHAYDPVIVRR